MLFDSEQPTTDSTAATAAAAQPAATPPTAEVDQSTELPGAELDTLQQPDPDEAEDEIEGVRLRGKKDVLERLKAERLMHADYTRKTQTLAEERRAWEGEREMHQKSVKMGEQMQQEKFQLFNVDNRMKQIPQLIQQYAQSPEAQQALRDEFMRLQAARPALVDSIRGKETQLQQYEQRERATLAQKALDYFTRELKDWSPEKDRELEQYAKGLGIDPQQLSHYMLRQPQIMSVLNKAAQYDKLMKQRAAKPAPKPPEPASRVGGAQATTTKSLSDMTPAEYRLARQKRKAQG